MIETLAESPRQRMEDHRPLRLGTSGRHEANQGVQGDHPTRPRHVDLDEGRSIPRLDPRRTAEVSPVRIAADCFAVRSAYQPDGEAGVKKGTEVSVPLSVKKPNELWPSQYTVPQ